MDANTSTPVASQAAPATVETVQAAAPPDPAEQFRLAMKAHRDAIQSALAHLNHAATLDIHDRLASQKNAINALAGAMNTLVAEIAPERQAQAPS